jgi:hypothetical protein
LPTLGLPTRATTGFAIGHDYTQSEGQGEQERNLGTYAEIYVYLGNLKLCKAYLSLDTWLTVLWVKQASSPTGRGERNEVRGGSQFETFLSE